MQEEQEGDRSQATWFSRANFTSEILSFIIFRKYRLEPGKWRSANHKKNWTARRQFMKGIRHMRKKGVKCPRHFSPPAGGSKNRFLTIGPECGFYGLWATARRKIWIICDILMYRSQKSTIGQKSYSDFSIDFFEIFDDFPQTHFNKTEDV